MLELMEMMRGGGVGKHQSKVVRSWETWLRNKLRERFGLVLFSIHPYCTKKGNKDVCCIATAGQKTSQVSAMLARNNRAVPEAS